MSMRPGTLADAAERQRLERAQAKRAAHLAHLREHIHHHHGRTILGFDLTTTQAIHREDWPECSVVW